MTSNQKSLNYKPDFQEHVSPLNSPQMLRFEVKPPLEETCQCSSKPWLIIAFSNQFMHYNGTL